MKRTLATATALLTLAIPGAVLACEGHEQKAQLKTLSSEQLAAQLKDKKATPVDANGADTRAKWGVIPGAVLLTSSSSFDPAKELPAAKDTALVFYCANTRCTASHKAAKRAMEAGYTDVAVLPDGIQGWKGAGNPVAQGAPRS